MGTADDGVDCLGIDVVARPLVFNAPRTRELRSRRCMMPLDWLFSSMYATWAIAMLAAAGSA